MLKTITFGRLAVAFIGALAVAAIAQPARSDPVWNIGGSMTVNGTNAPNNFSNTVPLTLGPTPIDGGTLILTTSIIPESGGAEWLILHYATTSGGPIVGNVNGAWELQAFAPLSAPANSLGYYFDWSSNGTLLTPTQTFGGGSLGPNPVTGSGTVFANNTFCPYSNCGYIDTSNNTVNFFASTSDYAATPGNNGSAFDTANDFEIGIEMQPVSPVSAPEPGTLAIFGSALAGLGLIALLRRRNTPPSAATGA
jgi:hypothetical protein